MKPYILISLMLVLASACGKPQGDVQSEQTRANELPPNKLTLACYAEVNPDGPGTKANRVDLALRSTDKEAGVTLEGSQDGFDFKVNWNYPMTSLNIFVKKGEDIILFTTARVPTLKHNDVATFTSIPEGPRIAVNCNVVEFRPAKSN